MTCGGCGKTIRLLDITDPDRDYAKIAVEAETTLPEDTTFDGKRHVPHRARCPKNAPVDTTPPVLVKKPCGCREKKAAEPYPNLLTHITKEHVQPSKA